MTLKMLDTFAGIGGFSYAAKYLIEPGIETTGFVEIDPFCQKILSKNFPNIPIHDDITTFTAKPFQYDIISGGFPCQDISVAGRQKGITQTTRSGLFYELIKVIRMVRPKYVILENVSAILNNGMGTVLAELYETGLYECEWATFPASLIGAAHQRDRWWLVAYPIGIRSRSQSKIQTGGNSSSSSNRSRNVTDSKSERLQGWQRNSKGEGRKILSSKQYDRNEIRSEVGCIDRVQSEKRDASNSNDNGLFTSKESRSTQETNGGSEERKDIIIESEGSSKSRDSRDVQLSITDTKSSTWDEHEVEREHGEVETQEISRDRDSSGDTRKSSNTISEGMEERISGFDKELQETGSARSSDSSSDRGSTSNSNGIRTQSKDERYNPSWKVPVGNGETRQTLSPKWRGYVSQPCLRRGDDGLRGRMDRLKALGNSVVPQCAAIPLQRVIQLEREQQ